MKKHAFYFAFLLTQSLLGQTQLGMRLERFAGIWAVETNPALVSTNPQGWDFTLGQTDAFWENSYAFLHNTSLPRAARNTKNLVSTANFPPDQPVIAASEKIVQGFFDPRRRMHGIGQFRLAGPGFSFKIKGQHTFGLTTALRGHASSYRIPKILSYDKLNEQPFLTDIRIAPFQASAMGWGEIGVLYAWNSPDVDDFVWSFAVQPKLLAGFEGGYGRLARQTVYQQLDEKNFNFLTGALDAAFTNSQFQVMQNQAITPKINGWGGAVNFGFNYAMLDEDGDSPTDFYWQAGAALLDFGQVKFSKNAERHLLDFNQPTQVSYQLFDGAQIPDELVHRMSQQFLQDSLASRVGSQFSIGLPTALSLQFSMKIFPKIYVSAVAEHRVPVFKNSLRRANTLAVVPRFENRWMSASLPVVWNDYRTLRMGFAGRLGPLVVGTDNLGWLREKNRQTGMDFYIGLKINGFRLVFKDLSRPLSRRDRSWKKVGCFDF